MYLNQKALWAHVETSPEQNQYGDVFRSTGKLINVRRQDHNEEIRTSDGTVHHVRSIYYTHEDVQLDDTLDGHLVVDLYDMNTFSGTRRLRRLKTL